MGTNFNLNLTYSISRRYTAAELVEALDLSVEDIIGAFYDEIEENYEELIDD